MMESSQPGREQTIRGPVVWNAVGSIQPTIVAPSVGTRVRCIGEVDVPDVRCGTSWSYSPRLQTAQV